MKEGIGVGVRPLDPHFVIGSGIMWFQRQKEIFFYFLKLGILGFGGPLAIIGMIQKDLVEDRAWMDLSEFQRVFALIKSMPGPIAFQTSVFFGRRRGGIVGASLAAFGIVFPAFCFMLLFGYYYQAYAQLKSAQFFLIGMQAAAVVMVLIGLKPLFLPYLRKPSYWFLLITAAALFAYSILPEPILILGGAGLWTLVVHEGKNISSRAVLLPFGAAAKLKSLILVCVKAGAIVFGTGLAIVPLLEKDFVERLHWMSHAQFMDALAMGQVTPGPVVITATFIGFQQLGLLGACVATGAIFAPSFFHMASWFPHAVKFLSRQKWVQHFSFAATAIIMGTLAVTVVRMVEPWRSNPWTFGIFALCLMAGLRWKIPSWALIPLGGILGLLLRFV